MLMLNLGFLNITFFDELNFYKFLFGFVLNISMIYIIARLIYFKIRQNRDYLFTLFIFNLVIFFISYILNSVELSMGVAFGIFAIFSILRYRTTTIPIKEMTYMFIAISIAIINGLGTGKIYLVLQLFINATFIVVTLSLEKVWVKNELFQNVLYEKIDLIKPERHPELIKDLKERTGLEIHRFEIGQIDFLRDVVRIKVFYYDLDNYGDPNDYENNKSDNF